jgi:hypothetical protein
MKIFFKVVLVLLILYVCAVAGEFFAGVLGAIAAVYFHASPYATTVIVRVLATVFFFCFVLVAWVVYSRRRARKSRRRNSVTTR